MSRVLLIKNANLYDPDPKGIRDILIVDEKVFSVAEHIDPPELSAPVEVVLNGIVQGDCVNRLTF